MSRRTELMILLTITLFTIVVVLLPIVYHQPYQTVTSVDFWSHSTRMRQFAAEGYINYEVDWTNIQRIEGEVEAQYYPPGFTLLLFSLRELGGLNYLTPSLISLLFAPLFCLFLYLIPRKIFGNGEIGLLTAFLGSCFITGSNMLGPTLPLASTLAVILIMEILLILLIIPKLSSKVLIASLFIGIIFISHRASIGAWFLMLPFLAIAPIIITKSKRHFLEQFHYPIIMATFGGIAVSMIFWINLPVESMMTLGGILPTALNEMIGININKPALLSLVLLSMISVMFLYSYPTSGRDLLHVFQPVVKRHISNKKLVLLCLLIPIILVSLSMFYIITNNLALPLTPNAFLAFWGHLSADYYGDNSARLIKQALYGWHWNLIPIVLIVPSMYLYFKSNRRHVFLSLSIGALTTLIMAFIVQDVFFDVKIQRLFFYIAPFVYFITAWGCHTLLKDVKVNINIKKAIGLMMAGSIIIVMFSSIQVIAPMPPEKIDGILWTGYTIQPDETIANTGYAAQEARGLGQMNHVVLGGLFNFDNEYQLWQYLNLFDTQYIFIPPEMTHLNTKLLSYDQIYLVFSNSETNVYMIGG